MFVFVCVFAEGRGGNSLFGMDRKIEGMFILAEGGAIVSVITTHFNGFYW